MNPIRRKEISFHSWKSPVYHPLYSPHHRRHVASRCRHVKNHGQAVFIGISAILRALYLRARKRRGRCIRRIVSVKQNRVKIGTGRMRRLHSRKLPLSRHRRCFPPIRRRIAHREARDGARVGRARRGAQSCRDSYAVCSTKVCQRTEYCTQWL